MPDITEDIQESKINVDANNSNVEASANNFIFPNESSEAKEAINKAEKTIMEAVESFAKALDSTSPWLTNELLDIFGNLKKIEWIEETKLWETSFNLLYEKNANKIPDKIRLILKDMLDALTQYNLVKNKSKTLEEMLRACGSIEDYSGCSSANFWEERTFMPWDLGNRKSN